MDAVFIFIAAWLIFILPWSIYWHYSRNKKITQNKLLIEKAFKERCIEDTFEPTLATIVRDQYQNIGEQGTLTLHRIFQSRGAYYLFICSQGEKGYLTQLSPDRVINALRSTPEILQKEFPNAK